MKYYLDITLLPDAEASLGFLWQKLYQQIHLALVETKVDDQSAVGVSFPEYKKQKYPLGNILRLLAVNESELKDLNLEKWLSRFTDYLSCSEIKEVPQNIDKYVTFERRQFKSNVLRLARRRAKRKGESFDEALKYYQGFKEESSTLPFINLQSQRTGQRLRIFIDRKWVKEPMPGRFSCYGLSKTATVPWF